MVFSRAQLQVTRLNVGHLNTYKKLQPAGPQNDACDKQNDVL